MRLMDRADEERSSGDMNKREHKTGLKQGHLKHRPESQELLPRHLREKNQTIWEINMLACFSEVPVHFRVVYAVWGINMMS